MEKIYTFLAILFAIELSPLCAQQIVLTHGWRSKAEAWENTRIKNYLVSEFGADSVFVPDLDGNERAITQANNLKNYLRQYNINFGRSVTHSMGGLNTRLYLRKQFLGVYGYDIPAPGQRVSQVYTIGTPHYGSRVANHRTLASIHLINTLWSAVYPGYYEEIQDNKLVTYGLTLSSAKMAWIIGAAYVADLLFIPRFGAPGFQDLKTDAPVITNEINASDRSYEDQITKIGIICYDSNPIMFRFLSHTVTESEAGVIILDAAVKQFRYLMLIVSWRNWRKAENKYKANPTSSNAADRDYYRWKFIKNAAAFAYYHESDYIYRKFILEETGEKKTDGIVTTASQAYPDADQYYYADNSTHLEEMDSPDVREALDQAISKWAKGSPPPAPANLAANDLTSFVQLNWTDNGADESGFKIERATDNNGSPGTWHQIAYTEPNVETYTDNDVQVDRTYWYRIRAWNTFGYSNWSNIISVTTYSAPPTLTAPTISPANHTQVGSVEVTLTLSPPGPESPENTSAPKIIRYTLDGSTPTENSQEYSYPFTLISSATVKARTFQEGETPSYTASKTYTITNGSSGNHKARVEIDPVDQWDSFTCRVVNESASAKINKVILTGQDNSTFDVFSGGQYFWVEPNLGVNNNGVTSNSAILWFTSHALAPGESDANGTGSDLDWNNKSLQAEIHFDDNKIFAAQMVNVGDSDDGNSELWQANFGTSGGTNPPPPPPPANGDYNATVTLEITNAQWDMFICRVENGSNSTPISSIDLAIQDIDGNFDVFGNGSLYTVSPNLGSNNNGTYSPNVTLNFSSSLAAGQSDVNTSGDMDGPITDIQVTIHYSDGTNNTLSMSKTGNDWVAQDGNGGGTNPPPSNDYNATLTLENTNVQWNNFICRVENGSNSKAIESIDLAIQDIDGNFDVFGNGSLYTVSPNLGSNNNGTYSSNVTLNFTLPLTAGQSDVNSSGDMDGPITDIRATFHYADGADRTIKMTKSGEDWIAQDGYGGASKRNARVRQHDANLIPHNIQLHPAYPNPFTNKTVIEFNLQKSGTVKLAVYDIRGREIKRLVDARVAAGRHRATWNGQDKNGNELSSGLYFLRLQAGPVHAVQKVVLKH